MNARETRQYEMLLRVRDFGNANRQAFSGCRIALQTFAAVSAAVDELATSDVVRRSTSLSGRSRGKRPARKALVALLMDVRRLARVLRAEGRTMPPFPLPDSRSDQALLTTGRQFARDAEQSADEFTSHGVGPARIAQATAAFESALQDRGISRAGFTAARTRIRDLLMTARLNVRRLDLIIANAIDTDPVIEAVWKRTRRVEDTRRTRLRVESRPADVGEITGQRLLRGVPGDADQRADEEAGGMIRPGRRELYVIE